MSVEKATEFLKAVSKDEKLRVLATGWTIDDLKAAAEKLKATGELSDADLDKLAVGGDCNYHCCAG